MDTLLTTSKWLSYVLRHHPESIDLIMDANGWVEIEHLLVQARLHGQALPREIIDEIVRTSDKQRFSVSEDGSRIRANQGHTVNIDLALQPATPPEKLFHGTASRFLDSIKKHGLLPGERHHVHLTSWRETALQVGSRHGKPVILEILTAPMLEHGFEFYLSANGVWLTARVPISYLKFPTLDI